MKIWSGLHNRSSSLARVSWYILGTRKSYFILRCVWNAEASLVLMRVQCSNWPCSLFTRLLFSNPGVGNREPRRMPFWENHSSENADAVKKNNSDLNSALFLVRASEWCKVSRPNSPLSSGVLVISRSVFGVDEIVILFYSFYSRSCDYSLCEFTRLTVCGLFDSVAP